MRAASREALGLYITGIGGAAFLLGLMPLVRMPPFVGLMFGIAAIAGAMFFIVATIRANGNLVCALLELILVGAFCFISLFGVMWYVLVFLPSSGQPFLSFSDFHTHAITKLE